MSESSKPAPSEAAPPTGAAGRMEPLVFPDWSGAQRAPQALSTEEMLRYCEANLAHVQSFPGWRERRAQGRCEAEFVL